ncbi:MAG: phosphoribosylformylglycinamidine synthase subunit PurL [Waddliaceae bacterium]|nr:phosphoribosylformylglycinamidine synthase subunit PurL [Waddliaceae bacterium]
MEIARQAGSPSTEAKRLLKELKEHFDYDIHALQLVYVYRSNHSVEIEELRNAAQQALLDPILEEVLSDERLRREYDWCVEFGPKSGVTDNLGQTAQCALEDRLGKPLSSSQVIRSGKRLYLKGNLNETQIYEMAANCLANPLVDDIFITQCSTEAKLYETISLDLSNDELIALSRRRQLALNLEEMQAIAAYYRREGVQELREEKGLPKWPTDGELEALAQTWSEHCKHKIFNACIRYQTEEKEEVIDRPFSLYIRGATKKIAEKVNFLLSVFHDNAGVVKFTKDYCLCFKVETHNSPSALDPYGGALTGILGVNRDIMGTGRGARLLANTDVFCFAEPNYEHPLPTRILHPKRILQGVRRGVEHGGNKSGVPTLNGSLVFDERYLGKPLVYCGSVGIMPNTLMGKASHEKELYAGDLIVVAGGRTGKDGIHGATFSSEAFHEDSPVSAVQIGDPFTQKKLHDFLLQARDRGLLRTLTDNGAGGFSSSIGELAQLTGGCTLHLDRAPLKYSGLSPWEILVSESQERMTLGVEASCLDQLRELADLHEVEIAHLGVFDDEGFFHVLYEGKTVVYLDMDFLHDGVPQLQLEAVWKGFSSQREIEKENDPRFCLDYGPQLKQLLAQPNICSKESIVRQYDHEVQGGTFVKPFCGVEEKGPSDAAVMRPIEIESNEAFVLSHGICPRYSDYDCYHMTALAIDEAVRNALAVGADPERLALLDNYCWPDPVYDPEHTPDGKEKLGQLIRSLQALYDVCVAWSTPLISGKDSMKNDYKIGKTKISVPPTVLISCMGMMDDSRKALTMDFKQEGHLIYLLGETKGELLGSEYHHCLGIKDVGILPEVQIESALLTFKALYQAIQNEYVASCHDCSDGGLAVALAESAFAGGLGATVQLDKVSRSNCSENFELLFSESPSRFIVTVPKNKQEAFERLFQSLSFACIGQVEADSRLRIKGLEQTIILDESIQDLQEAWQSNPISAV